MSVDKTTTKKSGKSLPWDTAKSSPTLQHQQQQENRSKRYEIQAVARSIYVIEGLKEGLAHPSDYHRTACCKYHVTGSFVGVHKAPALNKAFYTGLQTCGSVWTCAVCAAKIQERRREEVAKAIHFAYANNLQPVLVTLTFPHKKFHSLKSLLTGQSDALKRFRKGRKFDVFKEDIGFFGLIRSLELTYGEDNGWHPHTHELWFVKKDADANEIKEEILDFWWSACSRAGLVEDSQMLDFYKYSVDVKGNCSASDYLNKQDSSKNWGVDREVAKASSKKGRKAGLHPFMFLTEEKKNPARWLEYTHAIKGKSQLFWSHGLKKTMGIDDKTDEELAEEAKEDADLLGMLTADDWKIIRKTESRAKVLDIAENFPVSEAWAEIKQLLYSLNQ